MKLLMFCLVMNFSAMAWTANSGGCLMNQESMCVDYEDLPYDHHALGHLCEVSQGVYFPAGCPSESRIGRCVKKSGNGKAISHFYGITEPEVKSICEFMNEQFIAN